MRKNTSKPSTQQIPDVCTKIKKCLEKGNYVDTRHANERKKERSISLAKMLYVLRHGYHEKSKTRFDLSHNDWGYAIHGKTTEGDDIRIIVAFPEPYMLIVTVMHVQQIKK